MVNVSWVTFDVPQASHYRSANRRLGGGIIDPPLERCLQGAYR
jgi:hypothetical protein